MKIRLSDSFSYARLIRFTLPSIAMMIFTSIYSVVDGFFVSNFAGKTPFAAVNLIMPVLQILGTVGFMFGTGGTALISNTFGAGDKERANRYFSLIVYVAFGLGLVLAILGFVFIRPIAALFGAEGELLDNCVLYARIIICALPFYVLQMMFQSFSVAAEKPQLGLLVTVSAGLTNIILDAVLVVLLSGEYKLAGAAIATALAQMVGGIIPLFYFFRENNSILRLGKTRFESKPIYKACTNGSSEFMSNVSMNLVGILYNLQLMKYAGEDGVAAYGVMMYVSMIFSAAFLGYTIGVAPVIGFHYGAQNYVELKGLLRKSLVMISVFGVAMVGTAELLAAPISKAFVGYDVGLLKLTISGFRIFALCFAFLGFGIFVSGFFTALNDGLTSALIAFLRTLVFQSAAILILPMIWGFNGVWVSVVVAEFMSLVLGSVFLLLKKNKYRYW
ncbi:MAG: MATE family efflux transporter [Eubacteriales bacterium]|nr:MATE family efflux transporter [Eubacteriales bacterium]